MTWKIRDSYRKKLAAEERLLPASRRGGSLSVCLVYPNRYYVGMSSLGFQTVYRLLSEIPGIVCERAFLPDPNELKEYRSSGCRLMSLESQRELASFDLIAFSISFEQDYLTLPLMFELAGIPLLAVDRNATAPLILAGGAALFLNPEPIADFLDLVVLGEAEPLIDSLINEMRQACDRDTLVALASLIPGVYVPSLHLPLYRDELLTGWKTNRGAPERVQRVWSPTASGEVSFSIFYTADTEFDNLTLVEVSRGCPRGCRFCAAGFIYLPFRQHSLEAVLPRIDEGLPYRSRVGLVGAAVSDYREFGALCRAILDKGGTVSVSSLRIDGINEEMVEVLLRSGHKTVTLAPEGGSQRLRDLIHKEITESDILRAADLVIGKGILNLKLYFIIGLPTETDDDLGELIALVSRLRERVVDAARKHRRLGEITISVNPFIPKPFTPFQWCGMTPLKELERKESLLRRAFGALPNVRMQMENPRDALLQGALSRGARSLSRFILKAHELKGWKNAARALDLDIEEMACREIPLNELLPWDFIGSVSREHLAREYSAAFGLQGDEV